MSYIGRQNLGGAYRQLDDISSGFNGSDTTHTMQVNSQNVTVGDVNQIILSLGGVIQKPGTDFTVSGSVLTFTTAPASGLSFFAILLGSDNGGTVTPTDGSVTGDKIASDLSIATNVTITTADNTDTLTLTSTDADASSGPNLRMYRNSSSPADSDILGVLEYEGRNDNSEDIRYVQLTSFADDVSDGTEDGSYFITTSVGGTLRNRINVRPTEVVVNEESIDSDFRVESDGYSYMLFVDGGNDCVNIGASNDRGGLLNVEGNGGVVIRVADNNDALKLQSTDTDANAGPLLTLERSNNSAANADETGKIVFKAQNNANEATVYSRIVSQINDVTDGAEDGIISLQTIIAGTLREGMRYSDGGVVFNELSQDIDFRVESNSYANAFNVDANEDAVFVGTTSFYDTDTIFAVRSGSSSQNTMHISNTSGSSTGNLIYQSLNIEEGTGVGFQLMADYNDNQIFFRGDGNGFFDGAADAGNADFAEYFESTDGSAIAIGKTVVLDNGKVRASTDSDNASDIVGVVRHRKTVGVVGNSAWNKWKGKFKVDDYGVPLLEEYTITEWDEIVAEDADDLEITDRGEKKKLKQIKGDTIHHSYATDKIPSELTAPSDAVVKTKDADGNTYKRKILSDSYDASKEYVSREDRDEWNLIGLTGQVTMTKGQKTGDRWIKMRDISDTVEEWLIR